MRTQGRSVLMQIEDLIRTLTKVSAFEPNPVKRDELVSRSRVCLCEANNRGGITKIILVLEISDYLFK
jgi:hypothetical protein